MGFLHWISDGIRSGPRAQKKVLIPSPKTFSVSPESLILEQYHFQKVRFGLHTVSLLLWGAEKKERFPFYKWASNSLVLPEAKSSWLPQASLWWIMGLFLYFKNHGLFSLFHSSKFLQAELNKKCYFSWKWFNCNYICTQAGFQSGSDVLISYSELMRKMEIIEAFALTEEAKRSLHSHWPWR